jgi:hypothetical protein
MWCFRLITVLQLITWPYLSASRRGCRIGLHQLCITTEISWCFLRQLDRLAHLFCRVMCLHWLLSIGMRPFGPVVCCQGVCPALVRIHVLCQQTSCDYVSKTSGIKDQSMHFPSFSIIFHHFPIIYPSFSHNYHLLSSIIIYHYLSLSIINHYYLLMSQQSAGASTLAPGHRPWCQSASHWSHCLGEHLSRWGKAEFV